MRTWWLKLILGLLIIGLFAFVGVRLYKTMVNFIGVVVSGGELSVPSDEEWVEEEIWTQPPYYADDSIYDEVTAVREYAEGAPAPTDAP